MMVTSAQIRAARAAVRWTVRQLAERSGVHRNTITKIEAGAASHRPTIAAVVRALEAAGIEFVSGDAPGVLYAREDGPELPWAGPTTGPPPARRRRRKSKAGQK